MKIRHPALSVAALACGIALVIVGMLLRGGSAPPADASCVRCSEFAAKGSSAIDRAAPCGGCHEAEMAALRGSQHAWACRAFDPARDPPPPVPGIAAPAGVIGVAPLQQLLLPMPGGRWQVLDPARDTTSGAWFSIFGDEERRPGDFGHWTGRGMTFNAQCAVCHMTDLQRGYDAVRDAYTTTWRAAGISCSQCHGDMPGHGADPHKNKGAASFRARAMDGCGGCHSRREELTPAAAPGDDYQDHYRLFLADEPGLYQPDGRAEEEDFELGSLLMSPMGQAGVTCLDCHDPHSGGLRASVDDNSLCLGCHAAPGRRGALPVDPVTHSHHEPQSRGSRCVECHMPAQAYMARDLRRDHGFTIPDPLVAEEIGMRDACRDCHSDREPGWAAAWVDAWFDAKMDRPARRRTRAVARAMRLDRAVAPEIVSLVRTESNDAWKAVLVALLGPFADDADCHATLLGALDDPSPRVKTAAIRALARFADARPKITALRRDRVRLVRLFASWATRTTLSTDTAARREVETWLAIAADQPAGAVRQSELALVLGDAAGSVKWARRAVKWDPSAASYATLARALTALGETEEARAAWEKAKTMDR